MKIIHCIIFITFSLCACSGGDSDTDRLNNYLRTNFSTAIGKEKAVYIFIPDNQCKNCLNLNAVKVSGALNNSLYIITSMPGSYFRHFKNVYTDPANKMYSLAFVNYSNTIITTSNKKIQQIKTNADIESELSKLK